MTERRRITPVILSGGSGTRLWPLSRTARPKQLLALTHTETMLQVTAQRTLGFDRFLPPMIVASATHADEIESQLEEAGIIPDRLILEPAPRNTAPAIALAALAAEPDTILLVMPSDHVIADVPAFHAAIERAMPLAEAGWLVTFGIEPTSPETGYGYIQRGAAIAPGVQKVDHFVEKPDRETAESYLAQGCFSWNGGIFLFTAASYLAELKQHDPAILVATEESVATGRSEALRLYPDSLSFGRSPSDSIDYAVMEKAERVAVVPVEMGWSDVGSWDALHELAIKDVSGNAHHGEVLAIDTSNCLIRSEGPLVAAIGVKDIIVIATKDAILVMPRGDSQQVKLAVDALKRDGHITLDQPC